MKLTWFNIPEVGAGSLEVPLSRLAIAAVAQGLMPRLHVNPRLLTFVPTGNGRTQVNVHGYGPFGTLEEAPPGAVSDG